MAKPADKNPEIRKFQSAIYDRDIMETIHGNVCISCKGPADSFRDEVSQKEFTISGLCQRCQDSVFDLSDDD